MPDETQNADKQDGQPSIENQPVQQPGTVTEPGSAPAQTEAQSSESSAAPAAPDQVSNMEEPSPDKPSLAITSNGSAPKPKKFKKMVLGLIVFVILAANAIGAWWYLQSKKQTDNTPVAKNSVTEIDTLTIGATEGPANTFFPDEQLLGLYFGINRQVYEGLVGFTDKKITPLLAKSWVNPDERTWIFTLKPGITFHTGKPVTANEVKASLDDLKKYDYWSIFVSTIESVEVVNETEVKITTTEPDALLLNRLSLAFITDLSAADAAGKNGTGAYMLDSSATNDDYNTTLIPYDSYHGDRALSRKLVYKIFENDDAVVKALQEGTIDIAESIRVPATKEKLTKEGYTAIEFDSPGAFGMYLNMERGNTILKNKDMRLAIASAIDRQTMVDEVGQQHTPSYQIIPKSLPGHDASITMPEYSVENAKAALTKAGYKNEPLEFHWIEGIQAEAPILIKQLRAAGINIRERKFEEKTIPDMVADLRAGRFDLLTASFSSDFVDARDLLGALLHSTESTYPAHKDEAFDKLLADSDRAFDPAERTKKLQEANRYNADNLLWIPLRNSVYVAYYKPDIQIIQDYFGGGNVGAYYRKVGRSANQ